MDSSLITRLRSRFDHVYQDDFVTLLKVPPVRTGPMGDIYVPTAIDARWPHAATVPINMSPEHWTRGKHCHRGDAPTKNPEAFLLVNGTATLVWAPVSIPDNAPNESKQARLIGLTRQRIIHPGTLALINPRVYHEVVAESDGVLLAELMMAPEDIDYPDVHRLAPQ